MSEELLFTEVARPLIEAARLHGLLECPLATAPELAEYEKMFITAVAKAIGALTKKRENLSLDSDEVHSLFIYSFAKAGEAAFNWHQNRPVDISPEGMFNGRSPIEADERLIEYMAGIKLGDICYAAFSNWFEEEPEFAEINGIDPLLPLLEALKWTWRIGASCVLSRIEFLSRADSGGN